MSNPKKGHITYPEIEKEIELLELAWVDYSRLVEFMNSSETSMWKVCNLRKKLQGSVNDYYNNIHDRDDGCMPVGYFKKRKFKKRPLAWSKYYAKFCEGSIFDAYVAVDFFEEVSCCFYDYYSSDIVKLKKKFSEHVTFTDDLHGAYNRIMSLLKPMVPYLYDENGNGVKYTE